MAGWQEEVPDVEERSDRSARQNEVSELVDKVAAVAIGVEVGCKEDIVDTALAAVEDMGAASLVPEPSLRGFFYVMGEDLPEDAWERGLE